MRGKLGDGHGHVNKHAQSCGKCDIGPVHGCDDETIVTGHEAAKKISLAKYHCLR